MLSASHMICQHSVSNISYQNLTLYDVQNAIYVTQYYCPSSQHPGACQNFSNSSGVSSPFPTSLFRSLQCFTLGGFCWEPVAIKDISFDQVRGTHLDSRPGQLLCSDSTPCTGLKLSGIDLKHVQTGKKANGTWFVWKAHGVASNVAPPLSLPPANSQY